MAKKTAMRVPQEVREDKPEEERKLGVVGKSWQEKAKKLDKIFNFVAAHTSHFVTLNDNSYVQSFDEELAKNSNLPLHVRPLRRRYYWGNSDLDGYKKGDKGKAEVRTEKKVGKGYWEMTLKLGSNKKSKKTLKRGEFKRALDGFGVNLDVFKKAISIAAWKILGDKPLKPLAIIEGQSIPVLYHPDGRTDVIFEIKFDKGKGKTFDGHEEDVIEVEIEVKEKPKEMSECEVEALLDKSEAILFGDFEDDLERIYDAKPSRLFNHLVQWRGRDKKGFKEAFKSLPGDSWQTLSP